MSSEILVADDDTALSEMVGIILESSGYTPSFCADGAKTLGEFNRINPNLVLLDLMLPGMDGIEICRRIRQTLVVPIIMLTAKTDTIDVVAGLEAGAGDYMPRPFKSKELLARVVVRLRHLETQAEEVLKAADLEISLASRQVTRGGRDSGLTPLEYDLLVALASKSGRALDREGLLGQVWGLRHDADTRLVNVHVQRLCTKVEVNPDNSQTVLTVRGMGCRIGSAHSRAPLPPQCFATQGNNTGSVS